MKKIILFLAILFPVLVYADNIDEKKAAETAAAFWNSSPQSKSGAPDLELVLHSGMRNAGTGIASPFSMDPPRAGTPAYYVYSNVSGPGFVIVAGDDSVNPVLGYSFDSEFPAGQFPANLLDWLDNMDAQIEAARKACKGASAEVAGKWRDIRAGNVQVQLETADWDQTEPYNDLCPVIYGKKTYTGCTATAMAIVMRYHQWPEKGTGILPGYFTDTYGKKIDDLPLGHSYAWDDMLLEYGPDATDAQEEAVAVLMRDCGIMLQSDFCQVGSGGTGAYMHVIPELLMKYMDYDRTARYLMRSDYATSQWMEMMKSELDGGRPVLYSGVGDGVGHAFVLDGYTDDGYFSLNWGWSGIYNGMFLLDALNPDGVGAGGGTGAFNENQGALVSVKKNEGGDFVEDICFQAYTDEDGTGYNGLSADGDVVQNVPFNLSFGLLYNRGNVEFIGDFLLAVSDSAGNVVQELQSFNMPPDNPLPPGYGICTTVSCTVNVPVLEGYSIRMYYRSAKTPQWTVVSGNEENGCVWDLKISEDSTSGEGNCIESNTSLRFNKKEQRLYLSVPDGVAVSLFDQKGNDCTGLCEINGNEVVIDTADLPAGRCRLVLGKDGEKKELTFSLKAAIQMM